LSALHNITMNLFKMTNSNGVRFNHGQNIIANIIVTEIF
jgi:hypothetical protein